MSKNCKLEENLLEYYVTLWCDTQGPLISKIHLCVPGTGQRGSVFDNNGTGQYIWESGQGQIN